LPGVAALLTFAAVGTTLLMARLMWLVIQAGSHPASKPAAWLWVAWWASLAAVAGGALLVPGAARMPFAFAEVWTAAWPVGGGILLALTVGRLLRRLPGWLRVPAGDLVVPAEALAGYVADTLQMLVLRAPGPLAELDANTAAVHKRVRVWLLYLEALFADWTTVGLCLLGILLGLFVLFALPVLT